MCPNRAGSCRSGFVEAYDGKFAGASLSSLSKLFKSPSVKRARWNRREVNVKHTRPVTAVPCFWRVYASCWARHAQMARARKERTRRGFLASLDWAAACDRMKPQVSARFMETLRPRNILPVIGITLTLRLNCYILLGFMNVTCQCACVSVWCCFVCEIFRFGFSGL